MVTNNIPRTFFLISLLLLSGTAAVAQQHRTVISDAAARIPLRAAGVKVTGVPDTAVLRTGITNSNGMVSFNMLPAGNYTLHIRSMGYRDTAIHFSQPAGRFPALPDTVFVSAGHGLLLNEVTVKDNSPAVQMKGDTIEYNASKFRTKDNAVVEDLLKKLPGVNVERDGSIKAQGEQVRRVLVDGKEFFGSDPAVATRNLPANMIDKVQVLDKKSEAEEFTGVADGNREKTINIVTKKNMKRGFFGNASAGKGDRDYYEAGTNINSFVDDKQLSLLFKANNVNKSGFSGSELIKMAASNNEMFRQLPPAAISELVRMKGVTIQGSPEAMAEVARPRGLTDTKYGGVNFNNDRDRLKFRSSYFFNTGNTFSDAAYSRKYLLPDTAYNYDQTANDDSRNTNHRINLSGDIRLSDRTSLKISPRADITNSANSRQRGFRSTDAAGLQLLNEGSQTTAGNSRNTLASSGIILRQRLGKGSTLMLTVTPEYYKREETSLNRSASIFYNTPGGRREETTDQQTTGASAVSSVNANALFTQPLFKANSLQLGQMLYYSNGNYNTFVKTKDAEGNYSQLNDRLSDIYGADKLQYEGRMALSGAAGRLTYTVGAGWQHSSIGGFSDLKGYRVKGSYQALLPNAFAEMKFSKQSRMTFRYNMSANSPSVSSLQPLEDNSDPLYTRKGNPGLQQEKSQQWALAYNSFELASGRNFYANATFNWRNNSTTDSTSLDRNTGKQFSMPVNVSGNYSGALTAGWDMKIDNNGSSITTGLNVSLSKNTTFTNGQPGVNRTYAITPDASVNYYIGNNINLSARGSASWNMRRFSGAVQLPEKNWSFTYGTEALVTLPHNILLEAGLDGFSAVGMTSGYNNTILLLNAGISKGIGSRLSVRLEARDLLNRNENITRISGNGYIEDRRVNTLGRFFLLSAIYKFRHFPKPKN